jgi:hypothetical protein
MKKEKTRTPRRNPMAGSLSKGPFQPKVVPTAKQKEERRRRPKHPKQEDDA